MRIAGLALLAAGACTVGAAGRMEASYDFEGAPEVRAGVDGALGATGFEMPEHASTQEATFALVTFGVGWGGSGGYAAFALEVVGVPAPGGGTGVVSGMRIRVDQRCVRWSIGVGAARLLAQTHAEDTVDQFGPNPSVTRWYQDATAFGGFESCESGGFRGMVGAAYEAGVARLLFAPGP